MTREHKELLIDCGLVSQALNNTNITGKYHNLAADCNALFILIGGALAKTKTSILQIMQATGSDAGGAKAVGNVAKTITANNEVVELTITLASVLNTETITINDIVFTAHTDTTTKAERKFSIAGDDTADAGELVTLINDPNYGVPGVTASNVGAVITLISTSPGITEITAVSTDLTFTVATTKAICFCYLDYSALDTNFTHIAAKVTTTGDTIVSVMMIRGRTREAVTEVRISYPV